MKVQEKPVDQAVQPMDLTKTTEDLSITTAQATKCFSPFSAPPAGKLA